MIVKEEKITLIGENNDNNWAVLYVPRANARKRGIKSCMFGYFNSKEQAMENKRFHDNMGDLKTFRVGKVIEKQDILFR